MTDPREPERHDPESSEPSRPAPRRPAGGAPRRGAPARRAPRRAAARFARGRIFIGEILAATFSMYFRSFVLFTGIVILVFIPSIVLRIWASARAPELLFSVLDFVLAQIVAAAIIYGVFRQLKKQKAELGRCLSIALGRLFPLIGVVILTFLLCIVPVIPGFLTGFVFPALGYLLILLGFVFFLVIYVALSAAPAAVVVERTGVRAALGRSLTLTRGNRWRIFCVYFVLAILRFLVDRVWSALTVPGWSSDVVDRPLVTTLGDLAISIGFGALSAVAVAVIYYQLKVKVEGIDEDELAAIFD